MLEKIANAVLHVFVSDLACTPDTTGGVRCSEQLSTAPLLVLPDKFVVID